MGRDGNSEKVNIVIWGTGANASVFIHKILPVCMDEMGIKIVGVVDDCEKREGSCFCGFKVMHPSRLDQDENIDHVVQLETYGGLDITASKALLEDGLRDKLLLLPDFCKTINSNGFWKDKNILFIGDREEYDGYAYGAKYIFKHHEYYEKVEDFHGDINSFDFVFACGKWYTSQEQSVREGQVIRKQLLKKYDYDPRRILDSTVWGLYLHSGNCRINTKGELNPDKKFLVLTFDRYCGWAIIQLFFVSQIRYAEQNGYIPVIDLMNFRTQYTSEEDYEKVNIWNYYFDPITDYSLEEVYNSKNVYLCGKRFDTDEPNNGRINYNAKTTELLNTEKLKIFQDNNDKVLGVVYRGTDFSSAYNHPRPIGINEFISGVKQFMHKTGYDKVFLATEVKEVLEEFEREFNDRVYFIDQVRYSRNESRILANIKSDREEHEYRKSMEYLSVLHLLTCCDSIYGIDCGSTRYARCFKDYYEYFNTFTGRKNIPFAVKINDIKNKIGRKLCRELKIKEYRIV